MAGDMLWQLTASQAARQLRDGLISSRGLVSSCLERIKETDAGIGAWEHLDPAQALAQADEADQRRKRGKPTGRLHGLPVGIKDIFDTADMPTGWGTPIFAGRQPNEDAHVIRRLKEAGAVIMGKTVTTELAFMHPAGTSNPHDPARTPGGSSSGSAAAVAAGHVPLAIGSQTNGSTIRPASYCGIYGFKPTRGVIGRSGALQTSRHLDQIGVFARTIEDVALIGDAVSGHDRDDTMSYLRPGPDLSAGVAGDPPVEPALAWFDLTFLDRMDDSAREAFKELLDVLDSRVERLPAPKSFDRVLACHQIVHEYEFCHQLSDVIRDHREEISDTLQPVIDRAQGYSQVQYDEAVAMLAGAEQYFDQFFMDHDAIICPAAGGVAPLKHTGTGDPVFCTIWTFAGLPALSLPLMQAENDLPLGVQLVGSREEDDRLLRTARWLQDLLAAMAAETAQ
jgi:Asp-tRNA(Asn)/Glu-tRNA(Gln) amidotransferase A subunit family amidase